MTSADPAAPGLSGRQLAETHGLVKVGGRPTLGVYLRSLWQRRHFTLALARSKAYNRNQGSYLGQLWAVLTPLMWAAIYMLVFGVVLQTSRGVENYVAFLVVGVFLYRFTTQAMSAGANAITGNTGLVSSLQFPRALLPSAVVLAELLTLVPALVVMLAIVAGTGEPLTWRWLLLPIVVLLQWLFATGVAFAFARLVVDVRDFGNMVQFINRALLYTSGVFFSIDHYAGDGVLGTVLSYQPVAVYLQLARDCVLVEVGASPGLWAAGVGWALLAVVAGFVYFWRGEERYGRG